MGPRKMLATMNDKANDDVGEGGRDEQVAC